MACKSEPGIKSEEDETHATHSIEWSFRAAKERYNLDCNKAGTVRDVLNRSPQFRKGIEKHTTKELVIQTGGGAISSHFPCSLIKAQLTLTFIKASKTSEEATSSSGINPSQEAGTVNKSVVFNVSMRGDAGIVDIMKNRELKKIADYVTVYGYTGEMILQALKRDGRFDDAVFNRNCALRDTSTQVTREMSNIVDKIEDKTFKIFLLDSPSPPNNQPNSVDETQAASTERQSSESPSQKPPTIKTERRTEIKWRRPEVKLSCIQNLFRVEFSKNASLCRDVRMMKKLMALGDSVCQVRVEGSPAGSGFLLFGQFVLTNARVIKNAYNEQDRKLSNSVTVHFSYERLKQVGEGHKLTEVICYEYDPHVQGFGWALLKLDAEQNLPKSLLPSFGFLQSGGEISIIGHPEGGVKTIDVCVVVQPEAQKEVVEKAGCENQQKVHLIDDVQKQETQVMTLPNHGSSGSPVFDQDCKVVAMHAGGYPYHSVTNEPQSVVEYGYPLSSIIERLIIQLVVSERFDVLEMYLNTDCDHHDSILANLSKLVESGNFTPFKDLIRTAIDNQIFENADITKQLKVFFQEVEPDPIDADQRQPVQKH